MIHYLGGWVLVGSLLAFAAPPARGDDPPDRLEKKPRPVEQKPADRPAAKPDEKPTDKPDQKPADPTDDAIKLREKIAQEMQAAEKKLKDRDPGRDTQQLQDQAIRNIDKLIELARNPPPPQQQQQPMGGSPPPMGQPQGGESQPQPGTQQRPSGGQARRERRRQRQQQMERQAGGPASGGQQTPGPGHQKRGTSAPQSTGNQSGMGGMTSARQPDQLSDLVKDIWGHLPQ